MKKSQILLSVSLIMLVVGIIFMSIALALHELKNIPTCTTVWVICYVIYVLIMVGLFVAAWLVHKNEEKDQENEA